MAFRNACDDFIYTENLETSVPSEKAQKKPTKTEDPAITELLQILTKAWEQYQDDDGWANLSAAGNFVKRAKPDFDPRTYGVTKFVELVNKLSRYFDVSSEKKNSTVMYRVKLRPEQTEH